MGDAALMVEVEDLAAVLALAAAIQAAAWPEVVDVTPGARTVVLTVTPGADLSTLRRAVLALPVDPVSAADGPVVEIPVQYDGADLDEVARLTGLDVDEVVKAHSSTPWRVGFSGFAPGFAYLTGGDPRLVVPRREEPRTNVPAGAVGLAGEFSGVYPRRSPGGWQWIGRTDAVLWDAERTPPALLTPGSLVRFVPQEQEALPHAAPPVEPRRTVAVATDARARGMEVLRVGPLTLVEDLGRPGHATIGVTRAGAADRAALRLANRLVVNDERAAGIEVLLGGLELRARGMQTVALAGAPAQARVDGTPVGHHSVLTLRSGQTLTLGAPPTGLRTYVAVRGGIIVSPTLGSASTDTLSDLGPPPLAAGDVLEVGPEPRQPWLLDVAPVAVPGSEAVTLRAVLGPRVDCIADPTALTTTAWTLSSRSNRVGMRLEGAPLRRVPKGELPSEGIVRGAVQVPPGGAPVVFLADHPVTGGYPVVAVVVDADVDRAAQARPGQPVRFRLVSPPWRETP
jgi:KipI family sensor histidine kinase inhibitor